MLAVRSSNRAGDGKHARRLHAPNACASSVPMKLGTKILLLMLLITVAFPGIATWLPSQMFNR